MTSRFSSLFDPSNNKNHNNIFKTKKNKNRFNLSAEKKTIFKNSRFDFDSSEKNIFKNNKANNNNKFSNNRFTRNKNEKKGRLMTEVQNRLESNTIFGLISYRITEPQKKEEKNNYKKFPKINKFNKNIKIKEKQKDKDITLKDDDFPPLN